MGGELFVEETMQAYTSPTSLHGFCPGESAARLGIPKGFCFKTLNLGDAEWSSHELVRLAVGF